MVMAQKSAIGTCSVKQICAFFFLFTFSYLSIAIATRCKIDAVQHKTSLLVHISHSSGPSTHLWVTSYTAPNKIFIDYAAIPFLCINQKFSPSRKIKRVKKHDIAWINHRFEWRIVFSMRFKSAFEKKPITFIWHHIVTGFIIFFFF